MYVELINFYLRRKYEKNSNAFDSVSFGRFLYDNPCGRTVSSFHHRDGDGPRDNADIMTAVRSAVLGAGATADHIETMGYNLYPNNQYDDKGRMKSTVYEADNRMKIVLHNLDQTGKVMDAAINAGANHIDSVIFSVRNEQEYRDEALRRAVADAKRKADVIAKTLGRPVVNIISVGENHTEIMPRYAMSMKAAGDSMAENAATPMEAGTADFESHVTVVFEIV